MDITSSITYALAGLAVAHSLALAALRIPSYDVDSTHIALTGFVMDLMVLPMVYFVKHFGYPPVTNLIPIGLSLYIMISNYLVQVQGPRFTPVDLHGKVYIVTGANTGIGLQTARHLLSMGATVVIACRSESKGAAAKDELLGMRIENCTPEKIVVLPLDLCSFVSIRKFVELFAMKSLSLDGLINNAGVMMEKKDLIKENGFETMFTANYLGHFLLTNLLIPKLKQSKNARIVNLTSSTHWICKGIDFDNLMGEKSYSLFPNYAQSKLANILFTVELQRRFDEEIIKVNGLAANAVHPGIVLTEVTRNFNVFIRVLYAFANPIMKTLQKSPSQGAYTSVFAATAPELAGIGGKYFANCEYARVSPQAKDRQAAAKLWEISEKLTGLS